MPQKPRRRTVIAVLTVVGTTVIVGVIQGKLSRRWGLAPDLLAVGQRLESFATEFYELGVPIKPFGPV